MHLLTLPDTNKRMSLGELTIFCFVGFGGWWDGWWVGGFVDSWLVMVGGVVSWIVDLALGHRSAGIISWYRPDLD